MNTENPTTNLEPEEQTLTAYLDDELSADERARSEATPADSADTEAEIARLRQLSELIRAASPALEGSIDGVGERGSADALFARVEAAIDAPAVSAVSAVSTTGPQLRVIKGGGRRRVMASLVAVAAAAAVALVASKSLAPNGESAGTTPPRLASLGSEVLEVDFGKSTGTIFNVEGERGQPLAVVWIDDPKELYGPLPIEGIDKDSEEVTQ